MISARRTIGLAGSSIWLTCVGALFPIIALALVNTAVAWLAAAVLVAIVLALTLIDARTIREVRRLFLPLPPRTPADDVMLRRFKYVLWGEIGAFWIVNTVLSVLRRYELMTPADLLIVGIHFLPLAWVFKVRRYYALGTGFCVVVAVTSMFVPLNARIGIAPAWFLWSSLACGAIAIFCGIANAVEARRALRSGLPV